MQPATTAQPTTPMSTDGRGLSRRRLLQGAAVGTALLATGVRTARAADRPTVAVIGGGPGGLTAAHELAERGFQVTVLERKALGGKARSIPVPGTATDGRRDLPGEHGFRFFPGFYRNLPDTMRRIPVAGNPNGVWDNLTDAAGVVISRAGRREDIKLEASADMGSPERIVRNVVGALQLVVDVPAHELAWFASRLLVYLTSSEERRFAEWEYTNWWDFVRADQMSRGFQDVLAGGLTRTLVAAKADRASTRTIGKMAEAFVFSALGRETDGGLDRVLDAPTNEAWIDPWIAHLESLGVTFEAGLGQGFDVEGGKIAAARFVDAGGTERRLVADWFVLAVPAERTTQFWSPELLALDPSLARTGELVTDWMNGLQIFLREPINLVRGHVAYLDTPWALTSINQAQFWTERDFARDYGDGSATDCLSIDISDWTRPGVVFGRAAQDCTPDEIVEEVWEQLKLSVGDTGEEHLKRELVTSWFLDPAISYPDAGVTRAANDEPLLINTAGSWDLRPEAWTGVPNLFLAADFVRTDIDLATMESANEAARKAVNALLAEAGSNETPATVQTLVRPQELATAKELDRTLLQAGLPNAFDLPYPDIGALDLNQVLGVDLGAVLGQLDLGTTVGRLFRGLGF